MGSLEGQKVAVYVLTYVGENWETGSCDIVFCSIYTGLCKVCASENIEMKYTQ